MGRKSFNVIIYTQHINHFKEMRCCDNVIYTVQYTSIKIQFIIVIFIHIGLFCLNTRGLGLCMYVRVCIYYILSSSVCRRLFFFLQQYEKKKEDEDSLFYYAITGTGTVGIWC